MDRKIEGSDVLERFHRVQELEQLEGEWEHRGMVEAPAVDVQYTPTYSRSVEDGAVPLLPDFRVDLPVEAEDGKADGGAVGSGGAERRFQR